MKRGGASEGGPPLLELDPKYVDVIVKRYELFTGQPAERLEP